MEVVIRCWIRSQEAVADTDMWISIIFMSIKLIYDDY